MFLKSSDLEPRAFDEPGAGKKYVHRYTTMKLTVTEMLLIRNKHNK